VEHLQTFRFQSDFLQKLFGVFHPFLGPEISFQEMTVADFSATYQDGVRPAFKDLQKVLDIYFTGTQILYHTHIMGILKAHRSGHVGGRIGAVGADQGDNLGVKGCCFGKSPQPPFMKGGLGGISLVLISDFVIHT
jgi:hypothetical protein